MIDSTKDLTIFDPEAIWKKMTLKANEFIARELFVDIVKDGEIVYKNESAMDIQKYTKDELETLWSQHKRIVNPHKVPVDLSDELYDLKKKLMKEYRK